jgi:anti-sigma regulatory factor (Ser/Thr protein kinase)
MPARKHSLTLKNDLSELDRLHPFLQEIGQRMGVSKKCIFETNLTLEEVFTNIVLYGFNDHADHFIKITVTVGKGNFKVCVEDDGRPFNPLKVKKPDLPDKVEDCKPGGLGIHLIKHFMDDIQYKRYRNRNILTLTKKACPSERANSNEKLWETSFQ